MMTVNLQVAITFDETTCGKFVELIRLGIASGNRELATTLADVVKPATVNQSELFSKQPRNKRPQRN